MLDLALRYLQALRPAASIWATAPAVEEERGEQFRQAAKCGYTSFTRSARVGWLTLILLPLADRKGVACDVVKNPSPSSEEDRSGGNKDRRSSLQRFTDLAKRVIAVPKHEISEGATTHTVSAKPRRTR